ncbi:MAG: TPM domain-containing protein [Rhodanobacter sp.]
MKRWYLLPVLALALLAPAVLWSGVAHAADAVPKLTRHMTDLTGTLTPARVDRLDAKLVELEKAKGAQLVVLMVNTTKPQDIDAYSLAVVEANKVGRLKVDDGIMLLVAKNDRQDRIEVGYGLEGAVPDAATARIRREFIEPRFKTGDFYGGINAGVDALTGLISGDQMPPPRRGARSHVREDDGLQSNLIIGVLIALFLRTLLGGAKVWIRAPLGALLVGGGMWVLISAGAGLLGAVIGGVMMLMSGGAGRSIGGGGWGGFGGSGGGGFGGFGGGGGGGGFSGGGGSFGGGGSSGSW